MEKLARILLYITIGAFLVLLGALWLLHDAVDAGNFWEGLVAVVLILFAGRYVLVGAAGFVHSR